ncbi:hypothetical protein HPB49_021771 [Dermacentor silvarum]|uniref:Uncharacterized protein n=1 Tax=Dermacentor silvarum TaxID=543639 RepID=A0ACB8E3C7_DERSI|nr:hypothetical protein HPB49_021771 [Dermacentor silvarum]
MAETRMEDEDATGLEENEEDLGWQIVTSRKSRSTRRISGDGKTTPQSQQEQGNNSKNKGPTTTTFKNRIVKASRMPQLPQEHSKIVIRPRGGLNLSKVSTTAIGVAVIEASGLTPEQAREDVVCPNFTQNIVVVSTPDPSHAARSASRATSAERQWDAQTGAKERSRSKSPTRSRRRSPSKGRSRSRSREVQVRFEGGKQKPGDKTTSGTAWADKVKGTVRAAESGAGQPVGDNDARIEQLIKEVTYLRKANEELTKQVVELRKNSQTSSTKVAIAKPVNNDNSQEEENSPAPKKRAISPVETTVCSALEEIKEAIKQLRDATDRTTFKVDKLWKWRLTTEKRLSKVEAQGEDDEYLPSEAESVRSLPGEPSLTTEGQCRALQEALDVLADCLQTTVMQPFPEKTQYVLTGGTPEAQDKKGSSTTWLRQLEARWKQILHLIRRIAHHSGGAWHTNARTLVTINRRAPPLCGPPTAARYRSGAKDRTRAASLFDPCDMEGNRRAKQMTRMTTKNGTMGRCAVAGRRTGDPPSTQGQPLIGGHWQKS